jgi:hypothetical protein
LGGFTRPVGQAQIIKRLQRQSAPVFDQHSKATLDAHLLRFGTSRSTTTAASSPGRAKTRPCASGGCPSPSRPRASLPRPAATGAFAEPHAGSEVVTDDPLYSFAGRRRFSHSHDPELGRTNSAEHNERKLLVALSRWTPRYQHLSDAPLNAASLRIRTIATRFPST